MKIICLLFLLLFSNLAVFAQSKTDEMIFISGQLLNIETKKELPFAHIYNKRTKKGTISDESGFFGIGENNKNDTLIISFIGFNNLEYIIQNKLETVFYLKPNLHELNELTLLYQHPDKLYHIISGLKPTKEKGKAKSYLQIKTFYNNKQVELVESFYNAAYEGYDIEKLDLKAGRLGLREFENRVFTSLSSSKAILKNKLFQSDLGIYYLSPLTFSTRKMKKNFELTLISETYQNNDTIMYINFSPKKENLFDGIIGVNITQNKIVEIELSCESCSRYPFIPIFGNMKILKMDIRINKSFIEQNNEMVVNQFKLEYDMVYRKSIGPDIKISNSMLLQLYDFDSTFFVPKSTVVEKNDYQVISSTPYNSFFWERNNELKIYDRNNQNSKYYQSPDVYSNQYLYSTEKPINPELESFKKGIFESEVYEWDKKRLKFKPLKKETTNTDLDKIAFVSHAKHHFNKDLYRLSSFLYFDIDTYQDSTHYLIKSFFNGFDSFYSMKITNKVHVFTNIFFDLVEIKRRELLKIINQNNFDSQQIIEQFNKTNFELKEMQDKFIREVQRGENHKELEKWNTFVFDKLRINNMDLFSLIEHNKK